MKILSWNCQGLGNPWTVRSLRDIVWVQAPTICFLMETRLDKEGFDRQLGDLPFPNKIIVKQPNSGGGLALIWRAGVQMELHWFISYATFLSRNHCVPRVLGYLDPTRLVLWDRGP